uniref:Uncharacterized protein n=1 Tax=Helianthus annuus TaxID=4232 RepID=A0A251V9Z0_HELAN
MDLMNWISCCSLKLSCEDEWSSACGCCCCCFFGGRSYVLSFLWLYRELLWCFDLKVVACCSYSGYDAAGNGSDDYSRYVTPDVVDASHVVVWGCMHSYISLFQEHALDCCISLKPL